MSQPTPAQLQALLSYAAARLGVSPDELAATVANGGYEGLTAKLSDSSRQTLSALLGDPQNVQAFLQNPQVRAFLERYR